MSKLVIRCVILTIMLHGFMAAQCELGVNKPNIFISGDGTISAWPKPSASLAERFVINQPPRVDYAVFAAVGQTLTGTELQAIGQAVQNWNYESGFNGSETQIWGPTHIPFNYEGCYEWPCTPPFIPYMVFVKSTPAGMANPTDTARIYLYNMDYSCGAHCYPPHTHWYIRRGDVWVYWSNTNTELHSLTNTFAHELGSYIRVG